ncbi:MAG: HopJ type III effector protein [Flavobacteriaceae bacterium]|nr:HopJ type III effector protein [Flavobacteriaceae bacterium]
MNFLDKIKSTPEQISFEESIAYIDENYDFSPTSFKNGNVENEANQNNGSCKILSFGKLLGLTKEQTLHLFGDFYRKDVLEFPENEDHQNIRNFIKFGWEGVSFEQEALKEK